MYMYYISQDLCLIMYCIIQDSRVNHAATTMSPTPYPVLKQRISSWVLIHIYREMEKLSSLLFGNKPGDQA